MFKKFRRNERGDAAKLVSGIAITLVLAVVMFTLTMLVLGPWVSFATEYQQATNLTVDSGTLDTYVAMGNVSILNGSVYIGNSTATFTEGTEFIMNDTDGSVRFYSGSNGEADTEYNTSYQWRHADYLVGYGERAIASALPIIVTVGLTMTLAGIMFKQFGG